MTSSSSSKETETSIIIRNYKLGVDSFKKRILKAKESSSQNKKLDSLILTDSFNQKEKLINNEEVVWSSYDKLEKAKRSAVEMENITIDVARELDAQSEKMKHIGGKLNDMNKEINVGTGLINRMMKMQRRNKLLVALFSVILITIFFMILFFKLTAGNSEKAQNNNTSSAN